jgi:phage/plasmid-like protein (TIGR03299 family)
MAHEINELAEGVHSFVSAREDAWHRLGVTLDSTFDAQTALKEAHLADWNVRKVSLVAHDDDGTRVLVDNRWATVYTNPVTSETQYLGVVGSHYEPIQNEHHVGLLDAIVDESGAHFETAGSLRGGRETFVSMKLPNTMKVGGVDPVDLYLVALNSHDGSSAFRFLITPVRVVCANTQAAALGAAKSSFSVRHVKGATGAIEEARQALGLTFAYLDAFQEEAEQMIAAQLAEDEFLAITDRLFDIDKMTSERQLVTARAHQDAVMGLFRTSNTLEGLRGNRWAGYQAVTEYVDHFMAVRDNGTAAGVARAARAVTSRPVVQLKEQAFKLLQTA